MTIPILEEYPNYMPGVLGAGYHRLDGTRVIAVAAMAGCLAIPVDEFECKLPTTAAEVNTPNKGVIVLQADRTALADGKHYAADEGVLLCKSGGIAVRTETAVSDQDPVYVRHTAKGGNTVLGAFRNTPDGNAASTFELTVVATVDGAHFHMEENGVSLSWTSGASQTAAQKATAWAAYINAIDGYTASATDEVVEVTAAGGRALDFGMRGPATMFTFEDTSGATCARLRNARFEQDSASGALLRLADVME